MTMNEPGTRILDSASIRRDYEAVREWLLRNSERHFQEVMGVNLGPPPATPEFAALEENIRQALLRLGAGLRIRLDDVVKDPKTQPQCELDEAFTTASRAYYDAVVAPRIAADAATLPERRQHPQNAAEPGQPGRQPVPYAVLVSGSDAGLVERVLPGREVHSSWRWAEAQFSPAEWIRDLKLDVTGHGKGWVGAFMPDYNNGLAVDVTWVFYWEPTHLAGETPPHILAEKKAYNWSIDPKLDFLGSVFIHAWDAWNTSKEAGVSLDISVLLLPIPFIAQGPLGIPLVGFVSRERNVSSLSGQNIQKFVHLNSIYPLGLVSPNPLFKFNPHWIIVQAKATGWTRGDGSHVVVDLESGNNSVFLNFMQVLEENV